MSDAVQRVPRRRFPWKTLVGVLFLGSAAAVACLAYPPPEELMAHTWTLRTGVLAALQDGDTGQAQALLGEWERVNAKLPTSVLLRRGRPDAQVREESGALGKRLADLRAALSNQPETARERTVECFEAHRRCAALFYPVPPAPVVHEAAAGMPPCHVGHQHPMLELPADSSSAPTLTIDVQPDAKAGWNLRIQTANFRFAPEHASQAHVAGEGHAHLYVDGQKIARVYGEWYHIASLVPGEHVVLVTLNSNNHDDLAVGGTVIAAEAKVVVPDQKLAAYFGGEKQPSARGATDPSEEPAP